MGAQDGVEVGLIQAVEFKEKFLKGMTPQLDPTS